MFEVLKTFSFVDEADRKFHTLHAGEVVELHHDLNEEALLAEGYIKKASQVEAVKVADDDDVPRVTKAVKPKSKK